MTARLTAERHLILPPEIGEKIPVGDGQEYDVMVSTSGVITLRPKRRHKKSLLEHFQGMRGLEINRRRDPIPHRVLF
jgi:antitoxin component of MazEF toxin-antitoxin module